MSMMMVDGHRGYKNLTSAELGEIVELYRSGEKLRIIKDVYNLKNVAMVSYIGRKAGLHRITCRSRKSKVHGPSVDEQIAQHVHELERLRQVKAQQQLRFELVDETTITIHGVTDRFILSEGLVRLREFIQKHVPQHASTPAVRS